MREPPPILIIDQPCDAAINWVVERVSRSGLRVIRTFDLQAARHEHATCPCPHHGTTQCDCQMVVLLVYAGAGQPVSMVAHGYCGQTWFSIVDTPQQRAEAHIEEAIRAALMPNLPIRS